jgi:DNA-binding MarR family transcriptional regulator
MTQGEVVHLMTTAAKLLAQKRQLIERLHEDPGPEEREQIEQLLAKINRALDLLDGAGASGSD